MSNTAVQASLITNSKWQLYYFYSMFEFKSTATLTLSDKTLGTNTAQVIFNLLGPPVQLKRQSFLV